MPKLPQHFDQRNSTKQSIHFGNQKHVFIKQKDVRYVHAGINVGYEVDGKGNDAKRAVLVIGKAGNMFLVAGGPHNEKIKAPFTIHLIQVILAKKAMGYSHISGQSTRKDLLRSFEKCHEKILEQ